jgi:hypothetical protein
MLNNEMIIIKDNLPVTARWHLETMFIDFDFTIGHNFPRLVNWSEFIDKVDLGVYWEFGMCEFVGAQTFMICISDIDKTVVGINPDSDDLIVVYNTDITKYARTFDYLNKCIIDNSIDVNAMICKLEEIDGESFGRSDWRNLLNSIIVE